MTDDRPRALTVEETRTILIGRMITAFGGPGTSVVDTKGKAEWVVAGFPWGVADRRLWSDDETVLSAHLVQRHHVMSRWCRDATETEKVGLHTMYHEEACTHSHGKQSQ